MSKGSRSYCFVLNNFSPEDCDVLTGCVSTYYVIGQEVGESGTPHLQGYIVFKDAKTMSALKKLLPKAHWETTKGSPKRASDYCKKGVQSKSEWEELHELGPTFGLDAKFIEQGVLPKLRSEAGDTEKARWTEIRQLAEAGDWDTLGEKYPKESLIHDKCLLRCNQRKRKIDLSEVDGDMPHEWFVGPAGTGKSRTARDENPGAYIKDPTEKWWDGYAGQAVVIIDDFDKFQVKQGGDMKRWMDRYPFQAQVKGGYLMIRPRKIVVTSQYRPDEIWNDVPTVSAIERRCTQRRFGDVVVLSKYVSSFNPGN